LEPANLLGENGSEQSGVAFLLRPQRVVDPARRGAPHPVHEDADPFPVLAGELTDPHALRCRDVIDRVSGLTEHDDLDVAGLEPVPDESIDEVGRLVVGIGLPLEGLATPGEEVDFRSDRCLDLLLVVPEPEGGLDRRAVPLGILGIGAMDQSDAFGDVERSAVLLGQPDLSAELGEESLGGHRQSLRSERKSRKDSTWASVRPWSGGLVDRLRILGDGRNWTSTGTWTTSVDRKTGITHR